MKRMLYGITAIILVCALAMALAACNKQQAEEPPEDVIDLPIEAEGIVLNWQEALMARGTTLTLTHALSPDGAEGTPAYTSTNTAVAQVNDEGRVSAVGAGVATINVKLDDTHYAECRVIVGDIVVKAPEASDAEGDAAAPEAGGEAGDTTGETASEGADDTTGDVEGGTAGDTEGDPTGGTEGATTGDSGESGAQTPADSATDQEQAPAIRRTVIGTQGTSLFGSIQGAIDAAKAGDSIVVEEGVYNEEVNIAKTITLTGVNNPKLRAVTAQGTVDVKLQNVSVVSTDYPEAGEAAVHVLSGAKIEMTNCVVTTTATGEPTGGYGILVEKQSKGVRILGNSIGNFRYGVYICPTDQNVTVTGNRFSNMAVGIGLDVRQENAETNYPTLGRIADNEYNEVVKRTQFLHYGENYDGDFDFGDNEEENASEGNSSTGGSGLME